MSTFPSLTRRDFVRKTALATAATRLVSEMQAAPSLSEVAARPPEPKPGVVPIRWIDQVRPRCNPGATLGVAWPRGQCASASAFALRTEAGVAVPVQSWPLATWPDGTLKWTAHALPADASAADRYELVQGPPRDPVLRVTVTETERTVEIENGLLRCRLNKSGDVLVDSLVCEDREVGNRGRLICLREEQATDGARKTVPFQGRVSRLTIEQSGPVRAVVKVEGRHFRGDDSSRGWLPFVVRLYFYAGGDAIRVVHTFVYEGDPQVDVIAGLGLSFGVPLRGALHDRHVRFSGEEDGVFGEAVRGLTGLRRDPGAGVREAQVAGRATPPVESWDRRVTSRLHYVPAFADWTLFQPNSDGFEVTKRTREGFTWLSAARGQRAGGMAYVGTPQGGMAIGVRNFWQSHPAQLDIRGATADAADLTAWIWAPQAGPMDLRPYHDGMGQDTFVKQLEALEITYEDYEPGFDSPVGVARTSELMVWVLPSTPTRERIAAMAEAVRTPPVLMAEPAYLHRCGVFGGLWSPADRSRPAEAAIEDQLGAYFDFFVSQREQRRWYGFWNYGDVMHSYDADRHEWKYDIGGFAWDNSELSTDIWLWLYALRSGRADVFRYAEAMTRHTGEVDVHHLGRFAPLGSRHNVLHWGCSAKQLRISTAANRRYYYYLTGDERVGDLMREQIEAARALTMIQANRKVARDIVTAPDPNATEVYAGFGTDWGSLAAAWLTEWERTGDARMRDRLVAGMKAIAGQPRGFFTGGARLDLASGGFARSQSDRVNVSHLSAVFGLVEVCAELVSLIDIPEFTRAWLDYCELYNASADEQSRRLGQPLRGLNLQQGHSRLTAFAASKQGDVELARRAWTEFFQGAGGMNRRGKPDVRRLSGPAVLRPVDEAPAVSTNAVAQWGLAAIQCLALAGDALPSK